MRLLRRAFDLLAIVLFFSQFFIDSSIENMVSSLMASSIFIIATSLILHPRNCDMGAAFSGSIVFLVITSASIAPMLGTLLEGHSLTYTLLSPVETFFHRFVFAVILLIAHFLVSMKMSRPILKSMAKLGVVLKTNISLPGKCLWAFGVLGLLSLLMRKLPLPIEIFNFLQGFRYLLWAPFLLLLPPFYKETKQADKWFLLLYYIIQVGIALAHNTRMAMIGPLALVGTGWLALLLLGYIRVNQKKLIKGLLIGICGLFALVILSDFSTAMLIERDKRKDRSIGDQFSATLTTFQDKKALDDYRKSSVQMTDGVSADDVWLENYILNQFLARFVPIKFDDNCFNRVNSLNESELKSLREISDQKVQAMLPDPVLDALDIQVDKAFVTSFSIGDIINYLSKDGLLGGFVTGSMPAHAFAMYGWYYPFVMIVIIWFIFTIMRGLMSQYFEGVLFSNFSVFGLLIIFETFTNLLVEGTPGLFGMLIRGIWQNAIIFYISLQAIRFFLGIKITKYIGGRRLIKSYA